MFDSWSVDRASASETLAQSCLTASPRIGLDRRPHSARFKRGLDLVGALFGLVLLAPLLLTIAVLVTVTSPGPILFRQRRTGLNGAVFTIFKFRTMLVMEDGDCVPHACRNDERITPLGAFLRQSSLDELPQLINVVKGEMSIVGPRPHALAHDAHYSALLPGYSERFRVRPGLTGYAQIKGLRGEIRQLDCMARRIEADATYARNWSLLGDLGILLNTVPVLLSRENAY